MIRATAVGFGRGRRCIYVAGVVFWRPKGMPRGAPGCGLLTELITGLAPPDPQQPIGCWLWPFSVAGVGFNVAGVIF